MLIDVDNVGIRVKFGCLRPTCTSLFNMSINLALIDLDFVHPVFALTALLSMLVPHTTFSHCARGFLLVLNLGALFAMGFSIDVFVALRSTLRMHARLTMRSG